MRRGLWSVLFFLSSRRRHTRCALVTGVQTCALPISEEVDKLFAVHAAGPHRLSRLALPQLRTHARSDIIIISSIATLGHAANGAPYNMAKAAGEALALTLDRKSTRLNSSH